MSTVGEIIEAVKKLPEREKSEFLERLADVDFDDAWIAIRGRALHLHQTSNI